LFCLPENPEHAGKAMQLAHTLNPQVPPWRPGVIIRTKEFGLLFVQDAEDITGTKEVEPPYKLHPTREQRGDI
jgi:hypothetical protein